MGMSTFLKTQILSHVFRNIAYTSPPSVFAALFTVAPSDAGGGTEVTGGSYARVLTASSIWGAPLTSGDQVTITNSVTKLTFATATADWGTVVAVAFFDAITAGNMLWWGAVTPNRVIVTGDTPEYGLSDITPTLP